MDILKRWSSLGYAIYVHCSAGIYRSPQIMILHLIEEWNYDFDQAIELVKEKHVYANPNIELILNTEQKIRSQRQITSRRQLTLGGEEHVNFSQ